MNLQIIMKYKKVRLKYDKFLFQIIIILSIIISILKSVSANRPPRFITDGEPEIVIKLKESPETAVGQLIYQINGYDPDNDPLTFGVKQSPYSDIISVENIGKNQANIYLAKELDRETKEDYSLILTLTDGQYGDESYVTQSLFLLVLDINDNVPIFDPYPNYIEILENSPPGFLTACEAHDLDEGTYGQVLYFLQELNGENDMFSIHNYGTKGIIRLVGQLDYEKRNLYRLRVLAKDRASHQPIHTGTAEILIKVKDVDDQSPEFVQVQAVTRISEDAKPGTEVLKLTAIDGDHGINNKIKYSIERNSLFSIDENTGVIYTKDKLDRENSHVLNAAYTLKVTASEVTKINPPPYVQTEITIIISDVNDETPTFKEKLYRCEINENAQINTPIHFLEDVENIVYDYDSGKNGTFKLFIEPENDIFEVSPQLAVNEANFLIRVKNSTYLDYEKITEFKFKIIAKEITAPGKWSAADVHIYIRDQNDNFPKFLDAPYEIDIFENCDVGTSIAQIQALDKDSGDYGTTGIRYIHLRGGIANLLHLDPITGFINLKFPGDAAFDREVNSRHYLTIEARDNLGLGNQNTAQIIINILDVNDNAPIFLQRKYEATLIENKEEFETPLIVEARDMDLNGTENSDITYEIIDGLWKNNFTIDIKYGNIQPVGFIDFEELSNEISNLNSINLTVKARDSGMPSLHSEVSVIVYIQDVNDNPPIFEKKYYAKQILEDHTGGSEVLAVKAYDFDGSKPNNDVVYRIKSGASDKFVIGSDDGMISVANGASLDPDFTSPKKKIYILKVIALDGGLGSSQLTAVTTVNITIKDVNNKPPILINLATLRIPENTPVGTVVYQVTAADLDDSPVLRYHIDKNKSIAKREDGFSIKSSDYDFASAFDLNTVTGYIKITKLIDREKVENIKLEIIVEDLASATGPQRAEASLNIQIGDENDNNPKFKEPFYKRSITENSMNGVTILNVAAYDIDKNKTITFSMEGIANATNLLHLDSETGEIVVANKIDHEVNQWLNFSVRATDSGYPPRSSFVDVFINILDENDNNPYFITTAQNFSVKENSPIGTRIAVIEARDDDAGDYGKITFLMDRISSQGRFSIDADTGVLTVADKIDRESKDLYILIIEVWDNYQFGYSAGESRNAFKQIYINVIDENDSPPEVTLPIGCIQITEYHDTNEPIATIRGKDADDPSLPNGKLEMSIIKGNKDGLYKLNQVDAWTGQILTKKSLKNKYGNHSLTISIKDLGKPPNTIKRTLDICVADFNDHPPVFVSPAHNITIRVPENATVGTLVIQVYAIDDDVGLNALVKYKLKQDPLGNYKTFEIDSDTGMIFLKEKLNRSIQKIYEIRVEAYDQGIPTSLSSDLDLAIYVRNVNDYEPQFLVEQISVNFTEHTEPEVEKVKLPDTIDREEVDELDDPPSAVCYFIVHGNENNLFKLDQETHILTIERELDREMKPNHTLYIRATENCASDPSNTPKFNLQNLTFHQLVDDNDRKEAHQARIISSRRWSKATAFESSFDRYKISRKIRSPITEIKEENLNEDELMADGTVVRVFVKVLDINDNPPKFKSSVFTGGVTTNADFGLNFMKIEAIDPDEGPNAKIKYYLEGEIRRTLSEGLENVRNYPFLIDENTGEILLNFDPQKDMKGYFDFMVIANDTDGQKDSAHVYIYLLREDQKVRIVFRQQPPTLRDKIDLFRSTLSKVTKAIVNINEFKVHENHDGSVDKTKTDLYLHLVKDDNSIYEVSDVLNLIDTHVEDLDGLFKEFNVLDTQSSEQQLSFSQIGTDSIFVWLIFSNIFIVCILIVCLIFCVSQRSNFKRQLRAAKVNIYSHTSSEISSPDPSTRVPNTNKHSVEGSNPIWLKGSDNEWYKNFDDLKRTRKNSYSTDDNFSTIFKQSRLFDQPNDLNRHLNIYQQIDKLTNGAQMLAKKLETTEL